MQNRIHIGTALGGNIPAPLTKKSSAKHKETDSLSKTGGPASSNDNIT